MGHPTIYDNSSGWTVVPDYSEYDEHLWFSGQQPIMDGLRTLWCSMMEIPRLMNIMMLHVVNAHACELWGSTWTISPA